MPTGMLSLIPIPSPGTYRTQAGAVSEDHRSDPRRRRGCPPKQRRPLRSWATANLMWIVLETVLDLCKKRPRFFGLVPSSRRTPDEQDTRPLDVRDEPLLRPRPTPVRRAGGKPNTLPGVGVVVELHALAEGARTQERRLAQPRRAAQSTSLLSVLVAKPADRHVSWMTQMYTPPKP